jgi:hypothetical protein
LNPAVQVRAVNENGRAATSNAAAQVVTRQVAPGRYEATVMADAAQMLTIALDRPAADQAASGITSSTVIPDPAAEYRLRPADEPLLRSVASATGGAWRPVASALANGSGDSRTERRPLWPTLLALGLVLWFADLLVRRIRVFEPR